MENRFPVLKIGGHKRPLIRRPGTSCTQSRSLAATTIVQTKQKENVRAQNSSGKRPTTTATRKESSTLNDPQLVSLRKELFSNQDFTLLSDLELLRLNSHLREYATESSIKENYEIAEKCTKFSQLTRIELQNRRIITSFTSRPHASQQGSSADDKYSFERQFQVINEQFRVEVENRSKLHISELERFEKYWTTDMPRKYRKPSQNLLNLKEKEKNLALLGNIEAAQALHEEANLLSEKETSIAQQKIRSDYKIAKKQLEENHKKEMRIIESQREQRLAVLMTERDRKLKESQNREVVIQMKRKEQENGHLSRSNPRSITPIYGTCRRRVCQPPNQLLGELIPPNDKSYVFNEKKQILIKKKTKETVTKQENVVDTSIVDEPLSGPEEEIIQDSAEVPEIKSSDHQSPSNISNVVSLKEMEVLKEIEPPVIDFEDSEPEIALEPILIM